MIFFAIVLRNIELWVIKLNGHFPPYCILSTISKCSFVTKELIHPIEVRKNQVIKNYIFLKK